MSDKVSTRNARNVAQGIDALMLPGAAFNLWGPALSCSTEWQTKLCEGFANLGTEWQEFVSRRMQDDLSLLQQMGSLQSPDQAWAAYVKFWQKAAEDYSREFATMSRLTGELVSSGIAATQRRTEAATTQVQPPAKAA